MGPKKSKSAPRARRNANAATSEVTTVDLCVDELVSSVKISQEKGVNEEAPNPPSTRPKRQRTNAKKTAATANGDHKPTTNGATPVSCDDVQSSAAATSTEPLPKSNPTKKPRSKKTKPNSTNNQAVTSVQDGDVQASASTVPKPLTTKNNSSAAKSILRAARRLSQNAIRRLSGRLSGSSNDGASSRPSNINGIVGANDRLLRTASKPRTIRFRESGINIMEISCLPDKPAGMVRMPRSPPLSALLVQPAEVAKPTKTSKKKATTQGKRKRTQKAPKEAIIIEESTQEITPQQPREDYPSAVPELAQTMADVFEKWDQRCGNVMADAVPDTASVDNGRKYNLRRRKQ